MLFRKWGACPRMTAGINGSEFVTVHCHVVLLNESFLLYVCETETPGPQGMGVKGRSAEGRTESCTAKWRVGKVAASCDQVLTPGHLVCVTLPDPQASQGLLYLPLSSYPFPQFPSLVLFPQHPCTTTTSLSSAFSREIIVS